MDEVIVIEDDVYDVELERAIALSLQDQPTNKKRKLDLPSKSNDVVVIEDIPSKPKREKRLDEKENLENCTSQSGPATFYLNRINENQNSTTCSTITFSELLDKRNLRSIILTSFVVDMDWLSSQLPKGIPVTVVQHWDRESGKEGHVAISKDITVVHPPLLPTGNFHAKLMILKYDATLRVAISSANLTPEDWSQLNQVVWFQDFPRRSVGSLSDSEFRTELGRFLQSLTLNDAFLDHFDFSQAKAKLLASVPGYHKSTKLTYYGHMRLRSLVNSMYTNVKPQDRDLYCQASSIGNLFEKWLEEWKGSTSMTSLRILYPTKDEVIKKSSRRCSDILCLDEKFWNNSGFPRHLFCNLQAKSVSRQPYLFHSKMIVSVDTLENGSTTGWMYLGSHNFSAAAWGRLQKDGKQLHISNYELGVFLSSTDNNPKWLSEIPFILKGAAEYSDDDEPFMYTKHQRDFYSVKQRCRKCKKVIPYKVSEEICRDCMSCATCGVLLYSYFEVNGQFYCQQHYKEKTQKGGGDLTCDKCKERIQKGTTYQQTNNGEKFHWYCFVCSLCSGDLSDSFYQMQDKSYICKTCGDLISE